MKMPHRVSGLAPSDRRAGYVQVSGAGPQAFGAGIGEGLQTLGAGIEMFTERQRARESQIGKFNALRREQEFETNLNTELAEAKRTGSPDGVGYREKAEAIFAKRQSEFLEGIPEELRDEFATRAGAIKQQKVADALDFQYKAGDAWYKQSVADGLTKSQLAVEADPTQLETEMLRLEEQIDASDLSTIDKAALKLQVRRNLAAVGYKKALDAEHAAGPIDSVVGKIIGVESGGDPTAKNPNSSASGLGQFTDGTWRAVMKAHPEAGLTADGRFDPTQARLATKLHTQDNSDYLASKGFAVEDQTEGMLYLAHFAGAQGAVALLSADPNASVADILGPGVMKANGFLNGMDVSDIIAWADKKMDGAPTVSATDSNPLFNDLPYEDRLALRSDAETRWRQEEAARTAMQTSVYNARYNTLANGINDGTAGLMDIDQAREEGWLTDVDDIRKVQAMYAERNKELLFLRSAQAKDAAPDTVWNPYGEEDKKQQDALFKGDNGPARLTSADPNYVNANLIPRALRSGMFPPEAVGLLTGMIRNQSVNKATFAYDTLRQLRDADPRAFNQQFSEQVQKDLEFYEDRKDIYPQEDLFRILNGTYTPEEISRRNALYADGEKILNEKGGNYNITTLAGNLVGDLNRAAGNWTSAALSGVPVYARKMQDEFQTHFLDAYVKYGNPDDAQRVATEQMAKTWGPSDIGGTRVLMKYPPERLYKGDPAWMGVQVRREFPTIFDPALGGAQSFELVSDSQTETEYRSKKPPSYILTFRDSKGVPHAPTDADGAPLRWAPEKGPEEAAADAADFATKQAKAAAEQATADIEETYSRAKVMQQQTGTPIPQDLIDEYKEITGRDPVDDSPTEPINNPGSIPGPEIPPADGRTPTQVLLGKEPYAGPLQRARRERGGS